MFIVDVQGFQYGNGRNFLCKEIAILNSENGNYITGFIKLPFGINLFPHKIEKHMNWLRENIHGLAWDSCYDTIAYEDIGYHLRNFIVQNTNTWCENENICIMVKGNEKRQWIQNILPGYEILNFEDEQYECPPFSELNAIFKSHHCNNHVNNNLNCVLENVYNLYYWNKYIRK